MGNITGIWSVRCLSERRPKSDFHCSKELRDQFRQVINRFADYMEVECIYQEINDLPSSFPPSERKRPWGTGHVYFLRVMLWMGLS